VAARQGKKRAWHFSCPSDKGRAQPSASRRTPFAHPLTQKLNRSKQSLLHYALNGFTPVATIPHIRPASANMKICSIIPPSLHPSTHTSFPDVSEPGPSSFDCTPLLSALLLLLRRGLLAMPLVRNKIHNMRKTFTVEITYVPSREII
jgi:hypothetical protein